MLRYRYLAVAPVAAALALAPALPALAAGSVLTVGAPGGTAAAAGDQLNASLVGGSQATFFSSAGGSTGVRCSTSTFAATVQTNPDAPGTATESLTSQTFTNCTANVGGVNRVNSVTITNLPYAVSATSGGAVGLTGQVSSTVSLGTILGNITCRYALSDATLDGTAGGDGSIAFANQQFTKQSGPGLCFNTVFFTARYGPVVDSSQGGGTVFVN